MAGSLANSSQETKTVAKKLLNEMFFRFSLPDQILTDQGRQFKSALITELCNVLQIQKSRTTPYPQADGLVERSNRTLLSMLSIVVDEHASPNMVVSFEGCLHGV